MRKTSPEWRRRALQQCVVASYLALLAGCGGGGVYRATVVYSTDNVSFRELTIAFLISVCFVVIATYGVRLFVRSVQENRSTIGPALMIGIGVAGFMFVDTWVFVALLSLRRW